MTFKDLQKLVQSSKSNSKQQIKLFDKLRDKPFWIWNVEEHKQEDIRTKGDCCFKHIIGLATKQGIHKPLYDYEKIIFDSLSSSTIISNNVTTAGNYNKYLFHKDTENISGISNTSSKPNSRWKYPENTGGLLALEVLYLQQMKSLQ